MSGVLSPSAAKVQAAIRARGLALAVVELPSSTRSAAKAAQAVGCAVGQIVKSLLFMGRESGQPLLVLASGANRVDPGRLESSAGEPVAIANPEQVRMHTGFSIGGVPPVGHPTPLRTVIDRDLMGREQIWAAAGTPHAVFRLTPAELVALTGGAVAEVAEEARPRAGRDRGEP